ncbi:1797_t:CDS:2 [Acaulospora colombiana]|uniref:1797_t:CDS:1 n=1 Tax=Acaulospora colombiana TaxID=27376 RepID=A0ACA9L2K4_9GLOM|nr:1797_t:CDS:2 [Acaulospora colombiana]
MFVSSDEATDGEVEETPRAGAVWTRNHEACELNIEVAFENPLLEFTRLTEFKLQ